MSVVGGAAAVASACIGGVVVSRAPLSRAVGAETAACRPAPAGLAGRDGHPKCTSCRREQPRSSVTGQLTAAEQAARACFCPPQPASRARCPPRPGTQQPTRLVHIADDERHTGGQHKLVPPRQSVPLLLQPCQRRRRGAGWRGGLVGGAARLRADIGPGRQARRGGARHGGGAQGALRRRRALLLLLRLAGATHARRLRLPPLPAGAPRGPAGGAWGGRQRDRRGPKRPRAAAEAGQGDRRPPNAAQTHSSVGAPGRVVRRAPCMVAGPARAATWLSNLTVSRCRAGRRASAKTRTSEV